MTTERFLEQKRTDIHLVVDQAHEDFKRLTDQAIGMVTTLYLDVRLYNFFDQDYQSAIKYVEAYNDVLKQYGTAKPLYHSIQDINFYTNNPTVIFSGGVLQLNEEAQSKSWYSQITQVSHPVVFRDRTVQDDLSISILQKMDYYFLYDAYEKIVRVSINPIAIKQVFSNVTLQGDFYLIDEHGYIVYTNNPDIPWALNDIVFSEIKLTSEHIVARREINHNYLENWQVIGVVDQSVFTGELLESSRFILILSIINFVLPTLTILFISKSFHFRLEKILRHLKKIEKQNFEEYPYIKSKDEIGQLMGQINRMTRKINTLFNEVYKANLEKKDLQLKEKQAQLSALQSQINPHFLFNSLETIRMRSLIKNEIETANIIENMAGIFRNALTWGKEWVMVQDEVHLIQAFLEIQAYRFGDKLSYQLSVDPEVIHNQIPNLSILPFVENASIHGIEPIKDQGVIQIKIYKQVNAIAFEISDNGVGMTKEQLQQILDQLESENYMGDSVGIQNVYYRLKLYYKNDFVFSLSSEENKGTTVKLVLPNKKIEEDASFVKSDPR